VREIPYVAGRQAGVFTLEQALAAGWTRGAVRHALHTGRIDSLRRGVYRDAAGQRLDRFALARAKHVVPAIAASLATPGAVVSHSTAAILLGLPLPFLPARPCVSVVPWHTGDIGGVHVHRTTSMLEHVVPIGALQCTSVARTVIDIAREHGRDAAVVAADKALHENWVSPERLFSTLADCRRWPGVRTARTAVEAADGRAESPLESMSRLELVDWGVPVPELQSSIGDANGNPIGRVDFYWDEFGVVGEADGMHKYDGRLTRLHAEKLRQERLEETGLIIVRWGSADLPHFHTVAQRLRRAFSRGQRRPVGDRRWTLLPGQPL
jgi:hypothetical protein